MPEVRSAKVSGLSALIIALVCIISVLGLMEPALAAPPQTVAQSAILTDAETGQILYWKDADKQLPPASITKIMTLLLAMEEVKSGRIKLSDKVVASTRAASMGGSQIYLRENEEMTLGELLESIAVVSANDACVAVAEYISGTEEDFVALMNKRAKELGMKNTHFVNSNGLPAEGHYSSAHDIAIMSRELVKYNQILKYSKTWIGSLRGGKFHLRNTNELIVKYKGADGLKTGWTDEAGFCLSGTAKRDDVRLIAVVMHTPSDSARVTEAAKLLEYGFRNFERKSLAKKGEVVATAKVRKGARENVSLITRSAWNMLVPREDVNDIKVVPKVNGRIEAPIEKGQVLGRLVAVKGKKELGSIQLFAKEPVKKANIIVLFFRSIRDFFSSLLTFGRK
jgi:D-alanyl-D-alanine carboxypeptidase (penicillin-binding protein 5/6)